MGCKTIFLQAGFVALGLLISSTSFAEENHIEGVLSLDSAGQYESNLSYSTSQAKKKKKKKKRKGGKPTVDFSGYYVGNFQMSGKPKPIVKRSNTRLTCRGTTAIGAEFLATQTGSKITLQSNLGNFRGKVQRNAFNASSKQGQVKLQLKGKRPNPSRTDFQLTVRQTVLPGAICVYKYKVTFVPSF